LGRTWDTFDLPPPERKLLAKVDAVILTLASLGYFIKNLDQSNVNNAFLSGMKEDLDMFGNQLVTSVSIWTVGYVVGQIPSNLLLTRVSPRWVIPSLELGWGIATLATFGVKNYRALYALRFLVGFFESGFYPGIHYILGSWYTPREIGKRAMIFWLAGNLGTLFSGFLQAAAYTNLSGVGGHAGWRWLFVIDAIITLPIAVAGFFFYPTLPNQGVKPWWLGEEEFELAGRRMNKIGRAGRQPWSWNKVKRLGLSWHTYMLPLLYVIWNNGGIQNPIGYYLKSFNTKPYPVPGKSYTVSQINTIPLVGQAIFIVWAASWAWLSDGLLKGLRWPFIFLGAVITIIFAAIIRPMPLYNNVNAHIYLYWFLQLGNGAGPLILTWINELSSADTEKRAILVATANDLAYVVQAVAPNFVWKTTEFPAARTGFLWVLVLNSLLIVWTTIIVLLERHDKAKAAARRGSDSQSVDGVAVLGEGEDDLDKTDRDFIK